MKSKLLSRKKSVTAKTECDEPRNSYEGFGQEIRRDTCRGELRHSTSRYVKYDQQLGHHVTGVGEMVIDVRVEAERLLFDQSSFVLADDDLHLAGNDIEELLALMSIADSPVGCFWWYDHRKGHEVLVGLRRR